MLSRGAASVKKILPGITGGHDVARLTPPELEQLAEEIREIIITTVSRTGGHLAPSLGVVELTIALQAVFPARKKTISRSRGREYSIAA